MPDARAGLSSREQQAATRTARVLVASRQRCNHPIGAACDCGPSAKIARAARLRSSAGFRLSAQRLSSTSICETGRQPGRTAWVITSPGWTMGALRTKSPVCVACTIMPPPI